MGTRSVPDADPLRDDRMGRIRSLSRRRGSRSMLAGRSHSRRVQLELLHTAQVGPRVHTKA